MDPHESQNTTASTDGDRDTVRTSWEHSTPSYSVVEAVTRVTESTMTDMQPLYEVIDPDALDRLFDARSDGGPSATGLCVSFRYEGCRVTVDADGRLVVSASGSESE